LPVRSEATAGSPLKTKNFDKFFSGIAIAAVIVTALILAHFMFLGRRRTPASTAL
jgi:hypothetical protein